MDKYEYTTKKLADYVGEKYGGDMRYVIKQHKKIPVNYPQPPQATERRIAKDDGSEDTVEVYDYGEKLIDESKVKKTH